MAEFKNTFIAGKMNKDIDSRLMPEGEYRDALNIKIGSSSGSDIGAIENVLSNKQLTTESLGSVVNTVGAFFDNSQAMIYWFTTSETGDYVIEYDTINETTSIVLADTSAGVLNFSIDNLITGVGVIVDTDNDKRILTWTDGINPIRAINIATAKSYSTNGFNSEQISLYKRPPLNPPTLVLSTTDSEEENNLEERFLRFAYRYRYVDGEVSALSPFTETAFLPKSFRYDYSISSNESMVNQYNEVTIGFNTGVAEVVGIDVLVKESLSSTVYLVESFDKDEESWSNNSEESFLYVNSKTATSIAADQLKRLFDAVPLTAKALEILGNRIMLGNYTEGYNIADANGDKIKIEFTVDVDSEELTEGNPAQTMKSNRGYEIGIVYLDDDGRMTTVLTCATNTTFVKNSDSDKGNKLQVTIDNEAPEWATRYRFFLKQSKVNYETIVPSIFYQDGTYAWLKVEADERNKFSEGDFLYVKSDSSEILSTALQTRVLEIVDQEENFLESPDEEEIKQQAGWYFKIKPTGFRLNESDFQTFTSTEEGFRSRASDKNFETASGASQTYYEQPVYYGSAGLDDLSVSGTYTGTEDIRYIVDISNVGMPDSFRWSNDDGQTYSSDIPISGSAQLIENGISVTFGATTGHTSTDNWIISAKSEDVTDEWNKDGSDDGDAGSLKRRIIMAFRGKDVTNEVIKAGANITIDYDDTGSDNSEGGQLQYSQTFTSGTEYRNLEEWFYGDNIIDNLTYPTDPERIVFRRGYLQDQIVKIDGRTTSGTPNEPMLMIFASSANYGGAGSLRSTQDLTILELNNSVIFETIPLNNDESFFYEIGRTYDIVNNRHQGYDGDDQDQTASVPAILKLPVFNAFSWGNGFESYKIKDRFNEKEMLIDTRPSLDIENYRRNNRIADITYSKTFEQSTNFNGLNEFNSSTFNFLSMDDKYGSIQKLFSADTNLEVFQEDKVHTVLYNKDVLFDADGQGSIRETTNVLGTTPTPWAGEYGISTHPESFCFYGNMRYWTDVRRGTPLRRSQDGITEINLGMQDFFRDAFRDNPSTRKFGAYDLHNKEYIISDKGSYTVGYDNAVKGYTSFYSFEPQWMGGLNNNFYTFSNGQLYKHYDEDNPVRNNFYGVNYDSTVKLIVNQEPSLIKVVKNIMLEGNKSWATVIKSYINDETTSVTESTLTTSEYLNKEGKLHAYVRRNELLGDFTAKNAFGLGEIQSIASTTLTMKDTIHSSLSIGDSIYNASASLVGVVTAINKSNLSITLSSVGSLSANDFILGLKDGRVEGSEIRGYNFEIDLTDSTNTRTELYAVGTNLFKSNPT
tara:strand:- start:2210 stop:6154 length:3945 start_codon:yes stop_codon:yes gene_type:complete